MGAVALYGVLALLPLLLAAIGGAECLGLWTDFASATGLVAGAMMLLQLVTSGRFEWISGRVGIDTTMAFHKWMARAIAVLIILHPLLFVAPLLWSDPGAAMLRLWTMFTSPRFAAGAAAWLLVVVLVIMAVARDRLNIRYELWRALHLVMSLAAIILTLLHVLRVGLYSSDALLSGFWFLGAAATLAVTLVLYVARTLKLQCSPWRVTAVERVADDLWKMIVSGAQPFGHTAGQFAWLSVEPKLFPLFDHPFSIASSPAARDLHFLIKEAGDFTCSIGEIAPGTRIGLDGPHGSFTLVESQAEAILFIAGGVGIAPVLAILEDLSADQNKRPVRLISVCSSGERMFPPHLVNKAAHGLNFHAIYLVERNMKLEGQRLGTLNRETIAKMMDGLNPRNTLAMICGPPAMMSATTDLLSEQGLPLRMIRYERFDYADTPPSRKDRLVTRVFLGLATVIAGGMILFVFRNTVF